MVGKLLSSMTTAELEALEQQLNLTFGEMQVFRCLSKGKSIIETSMECNVSVATVGNRIADIKKKLLRVKVGE